LVWSEQQLQLLLIDLVQYRMSNATNRLGYQDLSLLHRASAVAPLTSSLNTTSNVISQKRPVAFNRNLAATLPFFARARTAVQGDYNAAASATPFQCARNAPSRAACVQCVLNNGGCYDDADRVCRLTAYSPAAADCRDAPTYRDCMICSATHGLPSEVAHGLCSRYYPRY